MTDNNDTRLALARSNVKPIVRFLDRMRQVIAEDYGEDAQLEPRGELQPAAQNAYEIRYSLRHPDDARLALTFIVTGENADIVLLEGHERSEPRNLSANPGQVDQHAYRLHEIEALKNAVRAKIVDHLRARDPSKAIHKRLQRSASSAI